MNVHERTQAAVVDEALRRDGDFEAHLASCDECRDFASTHRAALRLRGAEVQVARRRPLGEVKRRAGIVAGLTLMVGGLAGLGVLESTEPARVVVEDEAPPSELERLTISPEDLAAPAHDDELMALAELHREVWRDVAREPRTDETLTRTFGALAAWVAPRKTNPMRALGRAASPLSYTSEDSP